MNDKLGVMWLKENDPEYVSPAKKAARTRATPFSNEALEAFSDCTTRKVNGVWASVSNLGYEGGSEEVAGSIVPVYQPRQEIMVDAVKQLNEVVHRRGGAPGRSQRRRLAKRGRK